MFWNSVSICLVPRNARHWVQEHQDRRHTQALAADGRGRPEARRDAAAVLRRNSENGGLKAGEGAHPLNEFDARLQALDKKAKLAEVTR